MVKNIKGNILNINPEPIGVYQIENEIHQKFKKLLNSVWNKANSSFRQERDSGTRHICNQSGQNLFRDFTELAGIESVLKQIVLDYIEKIGNTCEDILFNSSWINKSEKGTVLSDHSHANSLISANYFVNYDEEKHTALSFANDRHDRWHTIKPLPALRMKAAPKLNMYNAPRITPTVKEGFVLVWRSNVVHGYEKPNLEGGRMTLSLNAMPTIVDSGLYKFEVSS